MIHFKFDKVFDEKPNIILVDGFTWRLDEDNKIIGLTIIDEEMSPTTRKSTLNYVARALKVKSREVKTLKGSYTISSNGVTYYKPNAETKKRGNCNHYEKHGDRIKEWKFYKMIEDMKIVRPQKRTIEAYNLNADKVEELRQKKLSNSCEEDHEKINEYFNKLTKYV